MTALILFDSGPSATAHHRRALFVHWLALAHLSHLNITATLQTLQLGEETYYEWQACVVIFHSGEREEKWLRQLPLPNGSKLLFPGDEDWPKPATPPAPAVEVELPAPAPAKPKIPTPTIAEGLPWYQVLGISDQATLAEADAAFRERALQWHPDVGGNDEAMIVLNRAIEEARLRLT